MEEDAEPRAGTGERAKRRATRRHGQAEEDAEPRAGAGQWKRTPTGVRGNQLTEGGRGWDSQTAASAREQRMGRASSRWAVKANRFQRNSSGRVQSKDRLAQDLRTVLMCSATQAREHGRLREDRACRTPTTAGLRASPAFSTSAMGKRSAAARGAHGRARIRSAARCTRKLCAEEVNYELTRVRIQAAVPPPGCLPALHPAVLASRLSTPLRPLSFPLSPPLPPSLFLLLLFFLRLLTLISALKLPARFVSLQLRRFVSPVTRCQCLCW